MTDNWQPATIEQKIGINFKYDQTLRLALIHPSYAKLIQEPDLDNQRLAYLGETILNLVVVDYLYDNFSHFQVGKLKALREKVVESDRLTKLWYDLGLGEAYPFLNLKEERHRLRTKENNPFEKGFKALVGALYIDRGFSQTRNWLQKNMIVPMLKKYLKPELEHSATEKHQQFLGGELLQSVAVDYLYAQILYAQPSKLKTLARKLTSKDAQSKYLKQIRESADWQEAIPNLSATKSFKLAIAQLYLKLNADNSKSSFRLTSAQVADNLFDDDEVMEQAIAILLKDGKPQKWIIQNVMGYPSQKYNEGREKYYKLTGQSPTAD